MRGGAALFKVGPEDLKREDAAIKQTGGRGRSQLGQVPRVD